MEITIAQVKFICGTFGLFLYFFSPIRRILTEKTWEGFMTELNHPAIIQLMFSIPPFNAGDNSTFVNYQHFVSSLNTSDWEFVDISSKLKVIFIIEVVSLVVYLYAVITINFCFVVIGDMISVHL